jgi:hypothetical protein
MKTIYKTTSTNGRWGLEVVGPDDVADRQKVFVNFAFQPLGKAGGIECFQLIPTEGNIAIISGDVECPEGTGTVMVHSADLQSSNVVSLLHAIPRGVFKRYDYKRRGSSYQQVMPDGGIVEASPALLLAAGILQPKDKPAEVPQPSFNSAFSDALKKIGG